MYNNALNINFNRFNDYDGYSLNLSFCFAQTSSGWESRYTFSGKEKDVETGYSYFGARYYDSDISVWLSRKLSGVDPLADKYPSMSAYMYTAGNPVMLVDPDGRFFVGIFGQKTKVKENKRGKIRVGLFASFSVRSMARKINKGKSDTAKQCFLSTANNPTKVHLKIIKRKSNNDFLGTHRAHDEDGNVLNWQGSGKGKFDKMPAYVKDKNGNLFYKEATISIFKDNIESLDEHNKDFSRIYKSEYKLNVDDLMISVISHEFDHNNNQEAISAIKQRQEGKSNDLDVEKSAELIQNRVSIEIIKNKKNEKE